jgi:hypothetical protein
MTGKRADAEPTGRCACRMQRRPGGCKRSGGDDELPAVHGMSKALLGHVLVSIL